MNLALHQLNQAISGFSFQTGDRNRGVAMGLAIGIARTLPLPSSEVDNPEQYYRTTCTPTVNPILSSFNEVIVFGLQDALDYVQRFWLLRYRAAHPLAFPVIPSVTSSERQSLLAFFGGDIDLCETDLDLFLRNTASVMMAANEVRRRLMEEAQP